MNLSYIWWEKMVLAVGRVLVICKAKKHTILCIFCFLQNTHPLPCTPKCMFLRYHLPAELKAHSVRKRNSHIQRRDFILLIQGMEVTLSCLFAGKNCVWTISKLSFQNSIICPLTFHLLQLLLFQMKPFCLPIWNSHGCLQRETEMFFPPLSLFANLGRA